MYWNWTDVPLEEKTLTYSSVGNCNTHHDMRSDSGDATVSAFSVFFYSTDANEQEHINPPLQKSR